MSIMMKEDSPYSKHNGILESKAALFKEHTCIVMKSSHFIKSLPEVDHEQLERKKICLPFKKSSIQNKNKAGKPFFLYFSKS